MQLGLSNTFAEQLEGLYVPWQPEGFPSPRLLQLNRPLLEELGLDDPAVEEHAAELFSGTLVPSDSVPLAQAYAGHQFGGFSPQLGDGRAVLLGEVVDRLGRRRDLQLKGSGPTPFSRGGDGKAALGPILREYLLGEAMHHLDVPTTRVLAAVSTGETVRRSRPLPGAVLTRVAASHLRVGTLQFFTARGDLEKLERLVSYTLERHHPERSDAENPAQALLEAVAESQAVLIARWMGLGFIHGVMNTDNFSLSGETIDYGPCSFMDAHDPATVHSSIDHGGRYAFDNQPKIGRWNMARMGEALLPLLDPKEAKAIAIVERTLDLFTDTHDRLWLDGMRDKLGLDGTQADDHRLVSDLLDWMTDEEKDHTSTFRRLGDEAASSDPSFEGERFASWHAAWQERLGSQDRQDVAARMNRINPVVIARNHLVEEALDAAHERDLAPFETLHDALTNPFELRPGQERFAEPAPPDFGPYQTFCGT